MDQKKSSKSSKEVTKGADGNWTVRHNSSGHITKAQRVDKGEAEKKPGGENKAIKGSSASKTIGSFEAKTHFSDLLRRAEAGEEFTIERRGVPVARLVSIHHDRDQAARAAADRILARRAELQNSGSGLSLKEILATRDEGRK